MNPKNNKHSQSKQRMAELLSNYIHPVMRRRTYSRKAATWNHNADSLTKAVNIQLSKWNTDSESSFTINVGVFVPAVYKICWDKAPPKFIQEVDCVVRRRIGDLLDSGDGKAKTDKWWRIDDDSSVEAIGNEVAEVITNVALPFLDRFDSLPSIRDFLLTTINERGIIPLNEIYIAVLEYLIGDSKSALHRLSNLHIDEKGKDWLSLADKVKHRLKA